MLSVIFGCGDVGRRIVKLLVSDRRNAREPIAFVRTSPSAVAGAAVGAKPYQVDLDNLQADLSECSGSQLYYTVAPQKTGRRDERTRALLAHFRSSRVRPSKVVLISTTGVYGDCNGEWIDESNPVNPQTDRGMRRLDSEHNWLRWGAEQDVPVCILRVPGIYAFSRIPRARIAKRVPVVNPQECGFTNRIHADDLALTCVAAMQRGAAGEVYNATDGVPGKISEYLQAAALIIGAEPLPEISMEQAKQELSAGMLSYLSESRKISNKKMQRQLGVKLNYPDFRVGLKY